MQPFSVRDAVANPTIAHLPGGDCPACAPGYPQPCRRVTGQGLHPVTFDAAGLATDWAWRRDTCAGAVHGEVDELILETRCSACGMPP